jgi:signal recognition particle subunit SRP54
MFESLGEKLQQTFDQLARKGRLSEDDVSQALREVRLALLEADVNYRVVKSFTQRIAERAVGADVARSLTPAQSVIKIVHQELITLLGEAKELNLADKPPSVIMLVGLQGSGKTTMAAKLALHLRNKGEHPLLVAADIYRPAAINQLQTLGRQLDMAVHAEPEGTPPATICANAVRRARREGFTVVLLDTAGRLQIDEPMMAELQEIRRQTEPQEVLLVVDAMTGQEAVSVADSFHQRVSVTGLAMTKIDGDARGGAALSVREVTGVPIKFLGVGERPSDLEPFYPDRLASRILGMGDVLSLIERAETAVTADQARSMEAKLRASSFTFEDFLEQLETLKQMGPLSEVLGMVPGMNRLAKQLPSEETDASMRRSEAIVRSMTAQERRNPKIMNASRKRRIARGSGTTVQDVNQLLRQFGEMQRMMKQLQKGRGMKGLLSMFG